MVKGYHATISMSENIISNSELDSSAFILVESSLIMNLCTVSGISIENTNILGSNTAVARIFQVSMDSQLEILNSEFNNLALPLLTSFDSSLSIQNTRLSNIISGEQIID